MTNHGNIASQNCTITSRHSAISNYTVIPGYTVIPAFAGMTDGITKAYF